MPRWRNNVQASVPLALAWGAGTCGYVLLWALKYPPVRMEVGAIVALLLGPVVLAVWCQYLQREGLDVLDPLHPCLAVLFLGFWCDLLFRSAKQGGLVTPDDYELLIAITATVAFVVGYMAPVGRLIARRLPLPLLITRYRIRVHARHWLVVLWCVITIFRLAYGASKGYGTFMFTQQPSTAAFSNLMITVGGYAQYALYFAVLVTVFCPGGPRLRWLILLAGLLVMESAIVSYMGWKGGPVVAVIGLLCATRGAKPQRWVKTFSLLFVMLTVISFPWVFGAVDQYRRVAELRGLGLDGLVAAAKMQGVDYRVTDTLMQRVGYGHMMARAVHAVDNGQIRLEPGSTMWPALFTFVPRGLWPDKPTMSIGGWYASRVLGWSGRGEAAVTLPGDFYINGGLAGVGIGMGLYGVFLAAVYAYLARRAASVSGCMLLLPAAIVFGTTMERNFAAIFAQACVTVLVTLGLLLVMWQPARAGGTRLSGRATIV